MSLARLALRFTAVHAIKGRTMAQDLVRDSSIVPLESAISEAPAPIALVFTDDSEAVPEGRELWGGTGTTTLVIIIAVAGASRLSNGEVEFHFPNTDEAIELALDTMERQIQVALMDPDNPWSEIWRGLVVNVTKVSSRRGGSTKEGARFAARQIAIEVETVHDPIPGAPAEHVWKKLLDHLAALPDADLRGAGDIMRALIEGKAWPTWKRTQAEMGWNRDALKATGLEPLAFHAAGDEEPAPLTELIVMPAGVSSNSEGTDDGRT